MHRTRAPSRIALGLGIVLVLAAHAAAAQQSALREVRRGALGTTGAGLMLGIPVGEFKDHVDLAGGFDLFVAPSVDRAGALGLRLDGSFLVYDNLHDVAYLSGGYVAYPVDVNTTSYIASFRVGPQLTLGEGPVRLYGFGLGGISYFATETSYGDCGCESYASTTEWDDVNLAWETGGGLQIALGRPRGRQVLLDLGARYLHNGRTSYVPAQTLTTGTITPVVSEANLVILQLGVSIGLR